MMMFGRSSGGQRWVVKGIVVWIELWEVRGVNGRSGVDGNKGGGW